MIEQLACAGCSEIRSLDREGHDWLVCSSPRGSVLTLSWDDTRGTLTLVRYLTRRDGACVVGRFRMLQQAADAAATL